MRYLADCHNHTVCSSDGSEPLERMVAAAAAAGLSLLCPTDHLDLLGRGGKVLEEWDWTPLLAQYQRVCAACPKGLELRLGVELGAPNLYPERTRELLSGTELDLVIGSMHNIKPKHGGLDFIELSYPDGAACAAALDDYFDSLLTLSRMEEIDVIGHIPYVLRYMNGRDGNRITLEPWRERIRAVLKSAADRGAGIEINTNRGRDVEQYRAILADFRDVGGEIVTLGSDAHLAADVGKGIAQAADLLRELGFTRYTVYRRRKPEFISL